MEVDDELKEVPWPGTLSNAPRDTNEMLSVLEFFDNTSCIMVADDNDKNGSYFERAAENREAGLLDTFGFIQKNGLIDCHAYSLLEVYHGIKELEECKGTHGLVKMRQNTRMSGLYSP